MKFKITRLSFRTSFPKDAVIRLLGLDGKISDWEYGVGLNGYPDAMYYNGIKIAYNVQRGFECFVHMSGKGCKTFEDNTDLSGWIELLSLLSKHRDLFSLGLIDIACDDLHIDNLKDLYYSFGSCELFKYKSFQSGSKNLLRVGSPQSSCSLVVSDFDTKPFYRAELQLKDKSVRLFLDFISISSSFEK